MDMKDPAHNPGVFRKTLGRFASGVTIITTVYEGMVYGMTANAFCSVSLEPALVLISVNNRSRMHTFLAQSGWYGVSILARNQELLSRHFSGRPQEQVRTPFVWHEGYPLIEGAVGWLTCQVVKTHLAGDHTLYIGQVESLACSDTCTPLVFYAGEYQSLERGVTIFHRSTDALSQRAALTLHRSTDELSQRDALQGSTFPPTTVDDLLYEPSWW